MSDTNNLTTFKRRLLLFPSLLVAAVSLPMAAGLIPPNRVYGFRTSASLASPAAWYGANYAAGITGVVLGLAGAVLVHNLLKGRPVDRFRALVSAGVAVVAVAASAVAGLLTS